MKEFRKNENNQFVCEECNKTYIRLSDLGKHIIKCHVSTKDYFDKWIKDKKEGICIICKKPTKFWILSKGYNKTCCKECKSKFIKQVKFQNHGDENYTNRIKAKETCLKLYGVEQSLQSKEIREKGKQTKKEKYDDEFFNNYEKGKETKIKKYGPDFSNREKANNTCLERYNNKFTFSLKEVQEKSKQTWIKNYNVDNPYQSEKIKEKIKKFYLEKYNVEYPSQVREIFEKQQKKSFWSKKYKDTNINYRGSYEFDFLEKYFEKYPDLINGPTIRYQFNEKNRIYFPDFLIPSLNLVIEIKNSYLLKTDKDKIEAKRKATIANGFNYIMIVDKDYPLFSLYSKILPL